MYVERAGGAFETAEVTLEPGGRFQIGSSSSPHGQGHDITFAQIAADRLSVRPDAVTLRFGDSATSPPGVGTFGSRSVSQAGSAVALAADRLVAAARVLAAELLGAEPEEVRHDAGGFAAAGRTLTWAELAAAATEPLRAAARFESANVFSSGAYAASVAIDRATGTLSVERLVAVDDAGTLINPLLVHGQVVGGAVQGLGECLTEEAVYDEAAQLRTGSFLDYSLLTAAEIPPIITGEVQTPSPLNPLGAKGAGEGGAVGTLPAVANAVADALGGRVVSPPFTAEKLWRALQEEPAAHAGGQRVKPGPFRYAAPDSLAEALELLAGEDARPLAGGQSLVPMLNFRLARPELLVDLNPVAELSGIELSGGRPADRRDDAPGRAAALGGGGRRLAAARPSPRPRRSRGDPQPRNRRRIGRPRRSGGRAAGRPHRPRCADATCARWPPDGSSTPQTFFEGPWMTALRSTSCSSRSRFRRRAGGRHGWRSSSTPALTEILRSPGWQSCARPANTPRSRCSAPGRCRSAPSGRARHCSAARAPAEVASLAAADIADDHRRALITALTGRALAQVVA